MADLLSWAGKQLQGAVSQINPFDGGANYNSVVNKRRKRPQQVVQRPQQNPQSIAPPTQPKRDNILGDTLDKVFKPPQNTLVQPKTIVTDQNRSQLAAEYNKNPQNKKFLGVDPKEFGYPEDKTTPRPQIPIQPKPKVPAIQNNISKAGIAQRTNQFNKMNVDQQRARVEDLQRRSTNQNTSNPNAVADRLNASRVLNAIQQKGKQKQGHLGTFGADLVKGFTDVAGGAVNKVVDTGRQGSRTAELNRLLTEKKISQQQYNTALGNVYKNSIDRKLVNNNGKLQIQQRTPLDFAKGYSQTGADLAATFAPVGTGVSLAKTGFKAALPQIAKEVAAWTGAATGADALNNRAITPESIAMNAGGAALGIAGGMIGTKGIKKAPDRLLASKPSQYLFGDKQPVQNAVMRQDLTRAISSGTVNKPVAFGNLTPEHQAATNRVLAGANVKPITDPSVVVHPAVISKLADKRVAREGLRPTEVSQMAFNAVHKPSTIIDATDKSLSARFAHQKSSNLTHNAYVGQSGGKASLKSVYPIRDNVLVSGDQVQAPAARLASNEPKLVPADRQLAGKITDAATTDSVAKNSKKVNKYLSEPVQSNPKGSQLSDKQSKLQKQMLQSEIPQNQITSGKNRAISSSSSGRAVQKTQEAIQPVESQRQLLQENRSFNVDNTTNVTNKRGFTRSIKDSGEVSSEVRSKVSGEYNVRSTDKLALSADEYAKRPLKTVTKEINDRLDTPAGRIADQDVADSIAVAKRLDAKGEFDQAQVIYDKLAEHGTKGGQAIQAFSLLRNRTPDGMKYHAVKTLKKAGVELNKAEQVQLGKLIDKVRNTKVGSEARDQAIFETVDFVSKKVPTSTPDKIVNFWRAGLLTSPRTTGGNILGNTSEAAARELWTNPVAVASDKFFSMFTGKRTKAFSGGRTEGFKEGIQKGSRYMKTGFDPRNMPNSKWDVNRRLNYKNKYVDKYVNGVYRWMGAQDQPFYYTAKAEAARDLARADAMNLGYKGNQVNEYIQSAIKNENWKPQTFKTARDATDYAKYAVYQNETMLGSMASGLKQGASKYKGGRAVADFVLPFSQVPSSVAMRIVDRTPVGVFKEVVTQIKNKSFDQRAMSEAIANGSFGVPVVLAGMGLANSGLITGAYPTDSKEKKLWEAEGKQPYSVKVGDRWYSLNYMQPFGTLLSIGKQVSEDKKAGKSEFEAWSNATAAAAKSVESQSFLQGLNGLLSAINDPNASATQYGKSAVGGVIPNIIRSAATAIDPYQRETGKGLKGVFIDSPIAGLPGVRQTLNTKIDMFGKDLEAKDNPINQFMNPLKPSKVRNKDDQVVSELRRLQDSDNGIVTTEFGKKSIAGVELTNDQIRSLNQSVNSLVKDKWAEAMQDPAYSSLSDEDKSTVLKKIKDGVANNVKGQFVRDNGLNSTKDYAVKDISGVSTTTAPKTYRQRYDKALVDYNNNKGSLSDIERIKTEQKLHRLSVQKDFDNDTVSLYGMSKKDVYNIVTNNKDGNKFIDNILRYGDAMVAAGIYTKNKFRDKYGNVKLTSGSSGGKRSGRKGGGKGSKSTSVASLNAILKASRAVKAPKPPKVAKAKTPKMGKTSLAKYKATKKVSQRKAAIPAPKKPKFV